MVLDGVDVERRVVEVGGRRRDEFGTGGLEEFLVDGQGLRAAALQLGEFLAVLLAQHGVDGVVETGGCERHTDGDESVHLLGLLGDRIKSLVLATLLEAFGAGDVDEDVGEHADGVGVAAEHHVGEAYVVVSVEVGGHDAGEHGFLVHLDIVEGLEGEGEVAEEAVDSEEADDGEVAEHAIERAGTVFARNEVGVFVALLGGELFVDLGALDKGVENIEDGVAAPCVGVFSKDLGFFIVGGSACDSVAVAAEGFELVDKFIDDIPCPVVRGLLDIDGPVRVENVVEETAVIVVASELGFEGGLEFQRSSGLL